VIGQKEIYAQNFDQGTAVGKGLETQPIGY
jgi:hypothetical protein